MQPLRALGSSSLVVVLSPAPACAWWNADLRWRPHTIGRHQAEIAASWTGGLGLAGQTGPKLYMVSFRDCPDCMRFEREASPPSRPPGVDTRVIEIARADSQRRRAIDAGRARDGGRALAEPQLAAAGAWDAVPARPGQRRASARPTATWRAPPSSRPAARWSKDLDPLLAANGVSFAYPTLSGGQDGQMRGCACEQRQTYRFVLKELGVPDAPRIGGLRVLGRRDLALEGPLADDLLDPLPPRASWPVSLFSVAARPG